MLNRLTDTLDFHGQALALRSERQRLLASNIANADTPGYIARELDFAKALQDATAGRGDAVGQAQGRTPAGAASGGLLDVSHTGHLQPSTLALAGGRLSTDRLLYATPAQTSLDANSVDMDRERAAFADNAVKYEATLRFINGNVRTMLDAIKGQAS
ncbi:flagellar basal body rod protein FlgB [Piscinibacter sakaiensis]|uniref:Flagellar basal body rod protein FlgB n=1 Tax=Piscinibacter sakaiensis TaxID=1547922 RepID=A0A0K8NUW8_PISS1|nr:flagellar basal body rod protein FlgB [Piscinibacter sakaiensis]GAP33750.1 flagellar basal-body rod protein FlgB [Piscinibacter sakaiensis]